MVSYRDFREGDLGLRREWILTSSCTMCVHSWNEGVVLTHWIKDIGQERDGPFLGSASSYFLSHVTVM